MIEVSTLPKYQVVAQYLQGKQGSVLDIGARDRVLLKYLGDTKLDYKSADLGEGHDYNIDLENPIKIEDRTFDYMVCLDVLEHLENIHACFDELCRVTKKDVFIALPCMSSLSKRLSFLFTGKLGTDKYELKAEHQGDRHRWLTVYDENISMIETRATRNNFIVTKRFDEIDEWYCRLGKLRDFIAKVVELFPSTASLFVGRTIFVISRTNA